MSLSRLQFERISNHFVSLSMPIAIPIAIPTATAISIATLIPSPIRFGLPTQGVVDQEKRLVRQIDNSVQVQADGGYQNAGVSFDILTDILILREVGYITFRGPIMFFHGMCRFESMIKLP